MASPTQFIRKYQKFFLAILCVVLMLTFVLDDALRFIGGNPLAGSGGGGRTATEVMATTRYGKITRGELVELRTIRNQVRNFLIAARQQALPDIPSQYVEQQVTNVIRTTSERELMDLQLLTKRAKQLGFAVSDESINDFVKQFIRNSEGDVVLSEVELDKLLKESNLTQHRLFDGVRDLLLGENYRSLAIYGLLPTSPAERWDLFQRTERSVKVEVLPLLVDSYIKDVPMPGDAQIAAFFDEHKHEFKNPNAPDAGFKIPPMAKYEFIQASFDQIFELEKAKVTDEEISKEYEARKDRDFLNPNNPELFNPAKDPAQEDGAAEGSTTPPDADAATPDAEGTGTDTPAAPESTEPAPESTEPGPELGSGAETPEAGTPEATDSESGDTPEADAPDQPESDADSADAGSANPGSCEYVQDPPAEGAPEETPTEEGSEEAPTEEAATEEAASRPELEDAAQDPPAEDAAAEASQPEDAAAESEASETDTPAAESTDTGAAATEDSAPLTADGDTPADQTSELDLEALAEQFRVPDDITNGRFRPLAEVKEQIRDNLARTRTMDIIKTKFDAIAEKMDNAVRIWEIAVAKANDAEAANAPNAAELRQKAGTRPKVDYAKLVANDPTLKAGETSLLSAQQLDERTDIGKSLLEDNRDFSMMPQPFYITVEQLPTFKVGRSMASFFGDRFLFWKTESNPERIPELAEVKDDVVKELRRIEARKLAKAHAEELMKQVAISKKPLKESLPSDLQDAVVETLPFTWLTQNMSATFLQNPGPSLSRLDAFPTARNGFMQTVFSLQVGELGVAMDDPQEQVFLVRMDSDLSPQGALQASFVSSEFESYQDNRMFDESNVVDSWQKQFHDTVGLQWKVNPDISTAEEEELLDEE